MAISDSGGNDLMLVTGASGFVGSAIAISARAAGYRVRVLVRRSSPRINIQPDDEVVVGDMCDRASLGPALKGVPEQALTPPPGVVSMRVNPETGLRVADSSGIVDFFYQEYLPPEQETLAGGVLWGERPREEVRNQLF